MINKISKLENFGVFQNFIWTSEIPNFKRFNLIYGWNRSGKTTVSRVFASCEKKSLYDKDAFKQYPEHGKFEITRSDGTIVKNSDIATNTLPVKVFNQDFIEDNVSFDSTNSSKPIIYVSKEDIESNKKLVKLKEDETTLEITYKEGKKNTEAKENAKNAFLSSLGRETAAIIFDKTYNKTKAEAKIKSVGINNFADKILSIENKKNIMKISRSEPGNPQTTFLESPFIDYADLFKQGERLLRRKIISEILERLKDSENEEAIVDDELNSWIKQGWDIHRRREESKRCLFCESNLASDFFDSLKKHFSEDYENLQNSIDLLVEKFEQGKLAAIPEKNSSLSPDLIGKYEVLANRYMELVKEQNNWIDYLVSWLHRKRNNPFDLDIPKVVAPPEGSILPLNEILCELNAVIANHNEKIKNYGTEVMKAREELELDAIASALLEIDYLKLERDQKEAEIKEHEAQEALNNNRAAISKLESETSNISKAIVNINQLLKGFFGRDEIQLESDGERKGYVITRGGLPAKNLSEGEKTAIAFSYFVVKVEEKAFAIGSGIIFIDDPISSFDSNFIYQCFSLISTRFDEAGQLFISTHNFQLFNLVKEWFIRKNKYIEEKNVILKIRGSDEKPVACEFFMMENYIDSDIRKARIIELDRTLRDFKSEYHFLFSLLSRFNDATSVYADFYTIGNVARRFFEIFADFKIPDSRNQKAKMTAIVNELNEGKSESDRISDSDWNRVYKLINSYSHNSDPASTIEHINRGESVDVIKILLKMIKESDPKHFQILESSLR